MNWKAFTNGALVPLKDIPTLPFDRWSKDLSSQVQDEGRRVLAFFIDERIKARELYVILGDDATSQIFAARADVAGLEEFPSLTPLMPSLHLFEREVWEETGLRPVGHPWLKPVRYSEDRADRETRMAEYPFYAMTGRQVHEVAVGPVHAGVIEPGHFRFQCHGETIHHLEIQLGYQHRGIERLLQAAPHPALAEKIAGDSAVAHVLAFAGLIEALSGTECPAKAHAIRGIALELERAAMHVGDLAAMLTDVGFLMGGALFGAIRTDLINTTLAVCGNRFGMGLVLPGGVAFDLDARLIASVEQKLEAAQKKFQRAVELCLMDQPSVLTRLEKTGVIDNEQARALGLVGPAARASGFATDVRVNHPFGSYRRSPARLITLDSGDAFARAYIRYVETLQSFEYIREQLASLEDSVIAAPQRHSFAPSALVASLTEGWRGEIVHVGITGDDGRLSRYKIKDPSFNNWSGLALAVRGNGISDFPLINKSFNLSYCAHDL